MEKVKRSVYQIFLRIGNKYTMNNGKYLVVDKTGNKIISYPNKYARSKFFTNYHSGWLYAQALSCAFNEAIENLKGDFSEGLLVGNNPFYGLVKGAKRLFNFDEVLFYVLKDFYSYSRERVKKNPFMMRKLKSSLKKINFFCGERV